MKDRRVSIGKKLILIVVSVFLLIPMMIVAAGDTLAERANLVTDSSAVREVTIDLTKGFLTEKILGTEYEETFDLNDSAGKYHYGSKFLLEANHEYDFMFKDAIELDGETYSIGVSIHDIVIKKPDRYSIDYEYIRIEDGTRVDATGNTLIRGLLSVGSEYTSIKTPSITWPDTWKDTTDYNVDQTFYDESGNPVHLDFYICIQDIDQANYLFDTTNRELYYTDGYGQSSFNKDDKASDNMLVSDDGVRRDISKGYSEAEGYGGFKEAMLYVPLHETETGLSVKIEGWGDVVRYPRIFVLKKADYKVEYYYQTEGEDGSGIYEDGKPVYPETPLSGVTRNGVVGTTVSVTDEDKKPVTELAERYVLDSDKTAEYTGEVLEDGTLVLKVYFKRVFTVIYNDGVTDEVVFEDQVTKNIPYNENTPKFNDGKDPERTGYDFIGWKPAVEEKVLKDGYYEAQWDPWKYYIAYDANGGSGTMEKQTFYFSDPTMDSSKNLFTRDGYRFIGFLYVDKDEKSRIIQYADFRDELVNKWGREQTILLVAQWEKIPDKPVNQPEDKPVYVMPVTGVE